MIDTSNFWILRISQKQGFGDGYPMCCRVLVLWDCWDLGMCGCCRVGGCFDC